MKENLAVLFAAIGMRDIRVSLEPTAFVRLLQCAERYAEQYGRTPPSEIPGVHAARELFHTVGIDPTKRRPSSEALLQRALKRKGFESVNALVDVGNWCSLEFLLPTCIYDAAKLVGEVSLRLGNESETYEALNGRLMEFAGRPVLVDDLGPFGSPLTDSLRTAVDLQTEQVLMGIWAPPSYSRRLLLDQARIFSARVLEACGGQIVSVDLLPAEQQTH